MIKEKQKLYDMDKLQMIFDNTTSKIDFFKKYSVSEVFIEKNIDKMDGSAWLEVSDSQELGEVFIEKHKDKVDWTWISHSQKLGESFIDKHQDYVDWDWISLRQNLSISFVVKHIDKLKIKNLQYNKSVDNKELEMFNIDVLHELVR